MIVRTWRGATSTRDAAAYAGYVERTGLAAYRRTPGNRGALILQRAMADRTEILVVSFWDSLEAIRAFAGSSVEDAVFYPEDDRYLVERDLTVHHYEVAALDLDPAEIRMAAGGRTGTAGREGQAV